MMTTTIRKPKPPPVMDMGEFDEPNNLLVYGESGVGKTVFGASGGPDTLVVRIEKGTRSALVLGSKAKLTPVYSWSEIEEVQKWLRNGAYRDYKWVILDSVHVMQEMMWRHIMDKVVQGNRSRDPDIPAQPDHLKMQLMIRRFMTLFCDLPVNCLFLAQPMNIETADGEEMVLPLIDGKKGGLARYTVGLMTSFGRMHMVETKSGREVRRITWQPDGPYTGKDRTGALAPHTDNKTLAEISDLIDTGGTKKIARPTARRVRTGTTRRRTA
jgi:hypothetical protein